MSRMWPATIAEKRTVLDDSSNRTTHDAKPRPNDQQQGNGVSGSPSTSTVLPLILSANIAFASMTFEPRSTARGRRGAAGNRR